MASTEEGRARGGFAGLGMAVEDHRGDLGIRGLAWLGIAAALVLLAAFAYQMLGP